MLCFLLLRFVSRCFTGSTTNHPHYQNNASTRQPHFRNNISYPQRNRDMIASVCRKQLEHQQHHLHPVQSTSILKDFVLFVFVCTVFDRFFLRFPWPFFVHHSIHHTIETMPQPNNHAIKTKTPSTKHTIKTMLPQANRTIKTMPPHANHIFETMFLYRHGGG